MSLRKTGIKTYYFMSIAFLFLILFACSNTPISNIQNIRQIEKPVETRDSAELTLMTFNIRAGGGKKNPGMSPKRVMATEENFIKIADAIKSVDPDIVGLQEVRGYNQAKFLAKKLNMNFTYRAHANQNWWGLAVLSKFNIIDMKTKLINSSNDNRIALMSMIDINGKTINVLNVHYALENYNGQVRATMRFLNRSEGPVVLMGDLNRRPLRPEIVPIRKKLIATCEATETYMGRCQGTGFGKIDYIFVDQNNFKVLDAGVVLRKHRDASDHIAYWATIKLNE